MDFPPPSFRAASVMVGVRAEFGSFFFSDRPCGSFAIFGAIMARWLSVRRASFGSPEGTSRHSHLDHRPGGRGGMENLSKLARGLGFRTSRAGGNPPHTWTVLDFSGEGQKASAAAFLTRLIGAKDEFVL
jgi:hypothetical protein